MAFDFDEVLGPVLAWFDIMGAHGSLDFPQRTNLLVVTKDFFFDADQQIPKVDHSSLEGFGLHQFQFDNLAFTFVEKLVADDLILWDVQGSIPPRAETVWMMGVSEMELLQQWHFITAAVAFWLPVIDRQRSPSCIRLLELCAGGYGGWKWVSSVLQSHCQQKCETVGVEMDFHVCDISVAGTWGFLDVENSVLPLLADVWVDTRTFVAPLPSMTHYQYRVLDLSSKGHGGAMANPTQMEDAVNIDAVAWAMTSTAFVFLVVSVILLLIQLLGTPPNLTPSFVTEVNELMTQRTMLRKLSSMHLEMVKCRGQLAATLDVERSKCRGQLAATLDVA